MLEALGTAQWVGPVPGGGECQATSQLLIPKRRELCVHSPVCPGTGTRREVVPVAHHQSDPLCCYLEALHRPAPTQWLPAPPAGWQQRKASSVLVICITLCKHAKTRVSLFHLHVGASVLVMALTLLVTLLHSASICSERVCRSLAQRCSLATWPQIALTASSLMALQPYSEHHSLRFSSFPGSMATSSTRA